MIIFMCAILVWFGRLHIEYDWDMNNLDMD